MAFKGAVHSNINITQSLIQDLIQDLIQGLIQGLVQDLIQGLIQDLIQDLRGVLTLTCWLLSHRRSTTSHSVVVFMRTPINQTPFRKTLI